MPAGHELESVAVHAKLPELKPTAVPLVAPDPPELPALSEIVLDPAGNVPLSALSSHVPEVARSSVPKPEVAPQLLLSTEADSALLQRLHMHQLTPSSFMADIHELAEPSSIAPFPLASQMPN